MVQLPRRRPREGAAEVVLLREIDTIAHRRSEVIRRSCGGVLDVR